MEQKSFVGIDRILIVSKQRQSLFEKSFQPANGIAATRWKDQIAINSQTMREVDLDIASSFFIKLIYLAEVRLWDRDVFW